jgi:hypothetical protein
MKKIFLSVLVSIFLLMSLVAPVAAKTTVIKGTVTALNGGMITLYSNKGETLVISLPADFDASALALGDTVLIKGTTLADGSFRAESVKVVTDVEVEDEDTDAADDQEDDQDTGSGKGNEKDNAKNNNKGGDDDAAGSNDDAASDEEGSKMDNAYCSGKKEKEHPMAVKIAAKYGVSAAWVMDKFCSGYGMGAIMLSLKTQQINGASPDSLLAQRAEGKGWGKIWHEQGLIGKEKSVEPPPGKLKRPEQGEKKE